MIKRGNALLSSVLYKLEGRKLEKENINKNEMLFDECVKYSICPNCGCILLNCSKPILVVNGVTEIVRYIYSCNNCTFKYEK